MEFMPSQQNGTPVQNLEWKFENYTTPDFDSVVARNLTLFAMAAISRSFNVSTYCDMQYGVSLDTV